MIALLVACAAPGPIDADYGAASCDSWPQVPLRDGKVITCSAERVVVRVDGVEVESELDQFRTALLADGWAIEADASAPRAPAIRWVRGEDRVVLGIAVASGDTWVTLARVLP